LADLEGQPWRLDDHLEDAVHDRDGSDGWRRGDSR